MNLRTPAGPRIHFVTCQSQTLQEDEAAHQHHFLILTHYECVLPSEGLSYLYFSKNYSIYPRTDASSLYWKVLQKFTGINK